MTNVDGKIAKASWDSAQRGELSMWTVYDRPPDYPDAFVARRFEIGTEPVPTDDVILASELEQLRRAFRRAGLTLISRSDGDEQQIVETWL
jgi:hypothetical protein